MFPVPKAWHPCNQVSGEELITKWSEKEKKKKKQNILGMTTTLSHITVQENLFAKYKL